MRLLPLLPLLCLLTACASAPLANCNSEPCKDSDLHQQTDDTLTGDKLPGKDQLTGEGTSGPIAGDSSHRADPSMTEKSESCGDSSQCLSSLEIEQSKMKKEDNRASYQWLASESDAEDLVIIISPAKYIQQSELENWRLTTECSSCTERRKIDFVSLSLDSNLDESLWTEMFKKFYKRAEEAKSTQILVLPGIEEVFLLKLGEQSELAKKVDRLIFLDPGTVNGLDTVLAMTSAASKVKKRSEDPSSLPSLEVLALNTGRGFEKDRRRILAGNLHFLFTELALSESVGISYLADWFLQSRLGINGPLIYGKANKAQIGKIRSISPAAWFQRTAGSKTEDIADDTLKLMLP